MKMLKTVWIIGLMIMASPAIAAKTTPPKIGVLLNPTSTDFTPENNPPCTAMLYVDNKAVFDRTNLERPIINIDGKDVILRISQVKYRSKPLATTDELLQEIWERDDLKVVIDYNVRSSNYYGVEYVAIITASRKSARKTGARKLQSYVGAYGVFGCPRHP
jgi:hypothetical protein